jgi:glycosyltransferase involved in cell wall biosynthesis
MEELQLQTSRRFSEAAPIRFLHELYSDQEMRRLYAAATHYLSLSFGEGWDQPAFEAAASGLKVIAPHHSAYPTYLDDTVARLIPSHEIPVQFEGDPYTALFFESAHWWQPDEQAAIGALRAAIDGRDDRLASARDKILTEFSLERAARRLIGLLEEVEPPAKRRFWPWPLVSRRA